MITIDDSKNNVKYTTLTVEGGEVYEIQYLRPPKVCISNNTEGEIKISTANNFTETNGVGEYLCIPPWGVVNDLYLAKNVMYIAPSASGKILIDRSATEWHL